MMDHHPTPRTARKLRSRLRRLVDALSTIFLIVGVVLTILLWVAPHAFADTRPTCVQAPTPASCDHQDPEVQGCVADAQTIATQDILAQGATIGRVERRYSQHCHVWWGRVFDLRAGSAANMEIAIAGTTLSALPTFVGPRYRILYSAMVFEQSPTQQVPALTGILSIDATTAPASATIPAITIAS